MEAILCGGSAGFAGLSCWFLCSIKKSAASGLWGSSRRSSHRSGLFSGLFLRKLALYCRRIAGMPLCLELLEVPWVQRTLRVLMGMRLFPEIFWDLQTSWGLVLLLLLISGLGVGLLSRSVLYGLVWIGAAAGLAFWRDHVRQKNRAEAVLGAMPGIYRSLAAAIASGQTLTQAVEYVASQGSGPAERAFQNMALRLQFGISTETAADLLQQELQVPGCELLCTALVVSHRTGSPLKGLLMRSARLAEKQEEYRRMIMVKTAQVRLSVQIVCLLPMCMVLLLSLISSDFLSGLTTPAGIISICVAALLDMVALLIIRRMVRGVL